MITEYYCLCSYLSTGQVVVVVQKIYSKMHLVLCTNTYHDVADSVNNGMVKNSKTWISWAQKITLLYNKKFLSYASDDMFWEIIMLQ